MKLYRLLERMEYSVLSGTADRDVSDIADDSTKVVFDSVFVCIKGKMLDGHDYVNEAISKGAAAVIVERQVFVPEHITVILVNNTKAALSYMAAAYYNYPAERIHTVGVTGTRGKTTTCKMIETLLTVGGLNVEYLKEAKNPLQLHRKLNDLALEKKDAVIIEVSSLSCKEYHFAGVTFDIGVLVSLMRAHIGLKEHSSYEEYIACKAQLFKQCKLGIVNADCNKLQEILKNHSCRIETFGRKRDARLYAQYPVLIQKTGCLGNQFYVGGVMCSCFELWMPGLFNIYNALAAIMVAREFGLDASKIKEGIAAVRVPGRYEPIPVSSSTTVLYDEALNAKSIRETLCTVREYVPRKLICVYRPLEVMDKVERYGVGKALAQYADEIYLVTDKDLEEVTDDISLGISEYNGTLKLAGNAFDAISLSLEEAGSKDVIVFAGKHREVYQEVAKVSLK